jgi:hypothetical protein
VFTSERGAPFTTAGFAQGVLIVAVVTAPSRPELSDPAGSPPIAHRREVTKSRCAAGAIRLIVARDVEPMKGRSAPPCLLSTASKIHSRKRGASATNPADRLGRVAKDDRRAENHAFNERGGTCVKCGMTWNAYRDRDSPLARQMRTGKKPSNKSA